MSEKNQTISEPSVNKEQALLQQLIQKMGSTPGIPDLAAAYVAAWGEIPNVVKNANNPHFGSDYADLAAVIDTIKPIFAKHKLALLQAPGPMQGDRITMQNILVHSSGQHLVFTTELPIGNKPTAQAAGSAHTYARRYGAVAVAGIAPVDDDGNQATEEVAPQRKAKKEKPAKETEETPTQGSYASVVEELKGRIAGCTSREQLEKDCKAEVQELGDKDVATVYIEKMRTFPKKAK